MSAAMPWRRLVARHELTAPLPAARSFAAHLADAQALTKELRAKWPVPDDPRDDQTCRNAAVWLAVATYAAERLGADAQQTYGWMFDDSSDTLTQVLHTVSGPDAAKLHEAWQRLFDNPRAVIHLANGMARGFYHYQHPEVVAESAPTQPERRDVFQLIRP